MRPFCVDSPERLQMVRFGRVDCGEEYRHLIWFSDVERMRERRKGGGEKRAAAASGDAAGVRRPTFGERDGFVYSSAVHL